jgi:hypothetical protein
VIRTRPSEDVIVGDGEFLIAMSQDELTLLGALLGMVKLGQRQYQVAAMNLLDALEDITDNQDFSSDALADVQPILEVRDPNTFDIIANYDDTHIFEFVV